MFRYARSKRDTLKVNRAAASTNEEIFKHKIKTTNDNGDNFVKLSRFSKLQAIFVEKELRCFHCCLKDNQRVWREDRTTE